MTDKAAKCFSSSATATRGRARLVQLYFQGVGPTLRLYKDHAEPILQGRVDGGDLAQLSPGAVMTILGAISGGVRSPPTSMHRTQG